MKRNKKKDVQGFKDEDRAQEMAAKALDRVQWSDIMVRDFPQIPFDSGFEISEAAKTYVRDFRGYGISNKCSDAFSTSYRYEFVVHFNSNRAFL